MWIILETAHQLNSLFRCTVLVDGQVLWHQGISTRAYHHQIYYQESPHVNSLRPGDAYMHRQPTTWLVQIMACHLFGAKPLSEPTLGYCHLDTWEQTSVKFNSKFKHFHSRKCIWKCCLENGGHFVSVSMCQPHQASEPGTKWLPFYRHQYIFYIYITFLSFLYIYLIQSSLNYAPKGLIDNLLSLVQVMTLCWTIAKPSIPAWTNDELVH